MDISIPVTIPDDRLNDAVAALRWKFGKKANGSDYTPNELRALWKGHVITELRAWHRARLETVAQSDDLGTT